MIKETIQRERQLRSTKMYAHNQKTLFYEKEVWFKQNLEEGRSRTPPEDYNEL